MFDVVPGDIMWHVLLRYRDCQRFTVLGYEIICLFLLVCAVVQCDVYVVYCVLVSFYLSFVRFSGLIFTVVGCDVRVYRTGFVNYITGFSPLFKVRKCFFPKLIDGFSS